MITSLSAGDEATILDGPVRATGLDWYQINASGDIGWVAGDYLDLASAGAMFNDGDTVYVYDGPINFRDGPGLTYDPIGILPQDQIATVIGIPVPDRLRVVRTRHRWRRLRRRMGSRGVPGYLYWDPSRDHSGGFPDRLLRLCQHAETAPAQR